MANGWRSSHRGSFKKRRSLGALPSGWPKPPIPSVERGTRTTRSSTPASLGSGLLRIPASGGTPESLTKPDGAAKGYAHVFRKRFPEDEVFCSRFGGKRREARCSHWIQADGRWSCPRRGLPSGLSKRQAVPRVASWSSTRPPASEPRRSTPRTPRAPAPILRSWPTCTTTWKTRPGLAGCLEHRHRSLRARQPGKDIAGVGRPGGKDRIAGQGPGCVSGGKPFAGRGRRQSSGTVSTFGFMICNAGPAAV